jgi:hypothetical protein
MDWKYKAYTTDIFEFLEEKQFEKGPVEGQYGDWRIIL